MYDFSGLVYRIWAVGGILLLIGIVCLLIDKPWSKGFNHKDVKISIILLIIAIGYILCCASRIISPRVSTYTGEFMDTHRNSRVAPPLPLTSEYVFWNGEGKRKVFYLDAFSEKKILPGEFEKGKKYTIYFDDFFKVIVRVEVVEEKNSG